MKRITAIFLAALMLFSAVACAETDSGAETSASPVTPQIAPQEREYDENDATAVLKEITDDFTDVITELTKKLTETFSAVGTTYGDYQENKGLIGEWVDLTLSESDALFARTKENSIAYFKLVAADPDHKYSEFCDEALDTYYDTLYDDALDDYYDSLYDDAMDNLYEQYYDGILHDAYDMENIEYREWSDASSECYRTWSDASSAVYRRWSDEKSYIYGLWSAMNSAFCWNGNYDTEAVIKKYEQEREARSGSAAEKEPGVSPEGTAHGVETSDEIRAEFKAAMDSYETFYDEYCEFMKKYRDNPDDLKIIGEYTDMLTKLADMDEGLASWENDGLNDAELKYYMEVSGRIAQKLLDIAQ